MRRKHSSQELDRRDAMEQQNLIKKLSYIKYFFERGIDLLSKGYPLNNALAILCFHDAAEQFLLLIATKLNLPSKKKRDFMDYWKDAKDKNVDLPCFNELEKFNKIRVNFKHYGALPDFDDCQEARINLSDFFCKVSLSSLGQDFSQISLSDSIKDRLIREHVKKAEEYLAEDKYEECIIECGKSFAYLLKLAEGDYLKSFVLREYDILNSGLQPSLSLGGSIRQSKELENNFTAIREAFRKQKEVLKQLVSSLNILLLDIDNYRFRRFICLIPHINISPDGRAYIFWSNTPYSNQFNYTKPNSIFCINFVIDSTLKFEFNNPQLMNSRFPQSIRIKTSNTQIYAFENNAFLKIGTIDKGQEIKTAFFAYKKGKYIWTFIHQDKRVYIDPDNVEWIGPDLSD
jgi:hypothetical protein